MTLTVGLDDFCRYVLDCNEEYYLDDPIALGNIFREYVGIDSTPTMESTARLIKSLGIVFAGAEYLSSGGINMHADGKWHICYSVHDRPATRKYTIFHELFEVINKRFKTHLPDFESLAEPKMSRHADRFAASVLIPPQFFTDKAHSTGCDIKRLSDELELSHQCLLIAFGQHFSDIPFVGALYENHPLNNNANKSVEDFLATVVVKTPKARRFKYLCGLQPIPRRREKARVGTLVCASITGGCSLLWRNEQATDSPVILVRPLMSAGNEPYRVIIMAFPSDEYNMIATQVDTIEPLQINGESHCSSEAMCQVTKTCRWRSS